MTKIFARAKANKQRIVLPEGDEERTLKAADQALADDIADLIILGDEHKIKELAAQWRLTHIDKATIINPASNPYQEELANLLYELRKAKGMTLEEAHKKVLNPLYFGCLLIKSGKGDGMLSGARSATSDVLRPALQIIKTKPGISCVSGAMLMITHAPQYGEDGILLFADIAVTPDPTPEQLAQIAYTSAQTARSVGGFEDPRIAMLSFSTKGSATHETVDKVIEAVKVAHETYPELKVDGELQSDAAIVPSVAAAKAPGSPIAGQANVLIFPNLNAGNIGYKLVQRLGNAYAIGPILQGIAHPVNDLSRGCSVDDVYKMIAVTSNQAFAAKE